MKTLSLSIAILCFVLTGNRLYAQKAVQNDTIIMRGKIVKEQFAHNKPIEGIYDYFFQLEDKKYFVKTYKARYSKADLDKWVGQQVEVKAIIKQDSWDDNGEGQSREGEHIVLLSIKKA